MEKTFAKATLLSGTVLAVFMLMVPINHLSAQNEVKIDEKARMWKANVINVDFKTDAVTVDIDGAAVDIVMNASSTVFLGNGDETQLPSLRKGVSVYVLGRYDPEMKNILVSKIVIRNKSITERTSLSRAELKSSKSDLKTPTLDMLGLSAK